VAAIEAQAHDNFGRAILWTAKLLPGARCIDRDGVVGVVGQVDFPSFRLALRTSDDLSASEWVDAAEQFLFEDGKTACIYARAGVDDDVHALLLERGFLQLSSLPEMVCDPPLDDRFPPGGFDVRLATTDAEVTAYARVAGEAFAHLAMDAGLVQQVLSTPSVLLAPDVALAVAERETDGAIVAGAFSIILRDGDRPTGYVAYVSCADDARGNGLGDAVTRLVTTEAFRRGASIVTLEASPYGRNTYARMGYRAVYDYRLLLKL
jgi:ribosomal protein S18 acetylase RimI-like enzyme